jgi:hypothetical protein
MTALIASDFANAQPLSRTVQKSPDVPKADIFGALMDALNGSDHYLVIENDGELHLIEVQGA